MKNKIKILSLIMILGLILSGCTEEKGEVNTSNSSNEEATVEETTSEEEISKIEPLTLNLEGGDWGYLTPYAHYSRGPGSYKMQLISDGMMER